MSLTKTSTLLGPAVGYVDLLNHATTSKLQKDKDDGTEYNKTPIRPSAAGNCSRELYYQLMQQTGRAKYDTDIKDANVHRLLNLGHNIEYHLIKQFDFLKDLFEIRYKQQVLSFEFLEAKNDKSLSQWLEGSLDIVLWSDKYKCVADVKSKKDKFSAFYKTAWDEQTAKLAAMKTTQAIGDENTSFWVDNLDEFLIELNDPFFAANFLQLNLYANSTFLKERGVEHAAIFQYCKNDSRLREIRFRPSEKLYKSVVKKFQNVITAVDTGNIEKAPRDYVLGNIKCAFCPFSKECWGEDSRSDKAFFSTLPPKVWPKDTSRMGASGKLIEKLFLSYEAKKTAEAEKATLEENILKLMVDANVPKLKLASGDVYEAKRLKDGLVLRRSKL